MSVVVIRDGIIAADTHIQIGDMVLQGSKIKRKGNIAIGTVGHAFDGGLFTDWYFDGADTEKLPVFHNRPEGKVNFQAIVLHPNGWEYWDEFFYRDLDMQRNPYLAIGSGCEAAMGAFHVGANSVGAVAAACASVATCSLPVEVEEIEQMAVIKQVLKKV